MVKQLNYALSDGLLITTVRIKDNTSLAICYLTDYNETTRIILDLDGERVVHSKVPVPDADVRGLIAAIKKDPDVIEALKK